MHCLRENWAEPHATVFLNVQPMFKKVFTNTSFVQLVYTNIAVINKLKRYKAVFYC